MAGQRETTLAEITREGRLAGRTLSILLAVTGAMVASAAWDELWLRCGVALGECVERAAGAALLVIGAVVSLLLGALLWWRLSRRPVDADGSSRYVWTLGVLFALGLIFVAGRIPAFTCARGRFDDLLELCMHPPTTSEPARWLLVKSAIVVTGLIGGAIVSARPSLVRVTSPVSSAAWLAGTSWIVLETLVLHRG